MKIIKQREMITSISYNLCFEVIKHPGSGYTFSCDEHGRVDLEKLAEEKPAAFANYNMCLIRVKSGEVKCLGVIKNEHTYWEPAEGVCSCGKVVYLTGFTNTCECGRDYNMSGQELAERSQWGEDTNEHLADILRIP